MYMKIEIKRTNVWREKKQTERDVDRGKQNKKEKEEEEEEWKDSHVSEMLFLVFSYSIV